MQKKIFVEIFLVTIFMQPLCSDSSSLWSTSNTHKGTGKFFGPGNFEKDQSLFPMTLKNIAFTSETDFLVPFHNNGNKSPNVCGELELRKDISGYLSNGLAINENADMCSANIGGKNMLVAVTDGSALQGQLHFLILDQREILVAMDMVFDLGTGAEGVIKLPFYGSTEKVKIPYSIQTQLELPGGTDSAGVHSSGTWIEGRVGDFDEDGWLDGTLVSAGNIPLDSPIFPGQPYAMVRHFEMDVPYGGYVLGNVKEVSSMIH